MAISKAKKSELLQQYSGELEGAQAVLLTNCAGLTVAQMQRVRRALRQEHSTAEVLRNALFAIAAERAGRPNLAEAPQGATLAVFCKGDASSPAKTLMALSREFERLKPYGGALGDRLLSSADLETLSNLPSREVILSQLVGGLQAPVYGFVAVLGGVLRGLLYALQARVDQLEGQASTEAA
ncbi:MAG: 50S ribosomal protein L10 [Anaerolineae bacterium]